MQGPIFKIFCNGFYSNCRAYSVFDLSYPTFTIPLEKDRPSLSLRDKFVTFSLLPAPLMEEDDATLLLIKSNGDVHLLSIRQNKE